MGKLMHVHPVKYGDVEAHGCNRLDPEYFIYSVFPDTSRVPISELMVIRKDAIAASALGTLPDMPFNFVEIGCVNRFSQVQPTIVQELNQVVDPEEYKDQERIHRKIAGRRSVIRYTTPQLLLGKTRPLLGKYVVYQGTENWYFSKDFIPVQPSEALFKTCAAAGANGKLDPYLVLLVLLKTVGRKWLSSIARSGTSYPVLHHTDLEQETMPKELFARMLTEEVVGTSLEIVHRIKAHQQLTNQLESDFGESS